MPAVRRVPVTAFGPVETPMPCDDGCCAGGVPCCCERVTTGASMSERIAAAASMRRTMRRPGENEECINLVSLKPSRTLLFGDGQVTINPGIVDYLRPSAGPANLDRAHACLRAESGDQARVIGRKITARARHVKNLPAASRVRDDDAC